MEKKRSTAPVLQYPSQLPVSSMKQHEGLLVLAALGLCTDYLGH